MKMCIVVILILFNVLNYLSSEVDDNDKSYQVNNEPLKLSKLCDETRIMRMNQLSDCIDNVDKHLKNNIHVKRTQYFCCTIEFTKRCYNVIKVNMFI